MQSARTIGDILSVTLFLFLLALVAVGQETELVEGQQDVGFGNANLRGYVIGRAEMRRRDPMDPLHGHLGGLAQADMASSLGLLGPGGAHPGIAVGVITGVRDIPGFSPWYDSTWVGFRGYVIPVTLSQWTPTTSLTTWSSLDYSYELNQFTIAGFNVDVIFDFYLGTTGEVARGFYDTACTQTGSIEEEAMVAVQAWIRGPSWQYASASLKTGISGMGPLASHRIESNLAPSFEKLSGYAQYSRQPTRIHFKVAIWEWVALPIWQLLEVAAEVLTKEDVEGFSGLLFLR